MAGIVLAFKDYTIKGGIFGSEWAGLENFKSLLFIWQPGMEGGLAIADILCGDANPSGKLTETWPISYDDVISKDTFGKKNTEYREGIYVGYRYFATANVPVLYPFGYGLSYSEFRYSDLQVEKQGEEVEVRVKVENISDLDGKEVVQLYVGEEDPAVERPVRELKAFQKVLIKAHETAEVVFRLTEEDFAYYSEDLHNWIANDGPFRIEICKNANEVLLSEQICR